MISVCTVLLPCGACFAIKLVIALFIKKAVIVGLLKREPLAVHMVIACLNTFLQGSNGI